MTRPSNERGVSEPPPLTSGEIEEALAWFNLEYKWVLDDHPARTIQALLSSLKGSAAQVPPSTAGWLPISTARDNSGAVAPPFDQGQAASAASENIAQFLFALLDDIDTASDRAKSDDKLYRELVERLHRRRFEVASTDGYTVTFHERQS